MHKLGSPALAQPHKIAPSSAKGSVGPVARGQAGGAGVANSGYQHTAGGRSRMEESAASGNIVMQFSESVPDEKFGSRR